MSDRRLTSWILRSSDRALRYSGEVIDVPFLTFPINSGLISTEAVAAKDSERLRSTLITSFSDSIEKITSPNTMLAKATETRAM